MAALILLSRVRLLSGCGWSSTPATTEKVRPGAERRGRLTDSLPAARPPAATTPRSPRSTTPASPQVGSIVQGKGGQKAQKEAAEKDAAERDASDREDQRSARQKREAKDAKEGAGADNRRRPATGAPSGASRPPRRAAARQPAAPAGDASRPRRRAPHRPASGARAFGAPGTAGPAPPPRGGSVTAAPIRRHPSRRPPPRRPPAGRRLLRQRRGRRPPTQAPPPPSMTQGTLMDDSEFHRLKRLPPYVFAEVNAMKARARAAGQDIIDLGMGNPDLPTAPHIVAKLAEAARQPARARLFGLARHPRPAQGAGRLLRAPLRRRARPRKRDHRHPGLEGGPRQSRPGDHRAGRHRAGAQPQLSDPSLRLHHRRRLGAPHPGAGQHLAAEFLPALERAVRHTVPKPIALVLNYPSNPTAQVVDLDFYAAVVDFCKRQGIWILSRPRLCRDLFRRQSAAVDPAGARARATSPSSSPR